MLPSWNTVMPFDFTYGAGDPSETSVARDAGFAGSSFTILFSSMLEA
jgi:hypothetical protein